MIPFRPLACRRLLIASYDGNVHTHIVPCFLLAAGKCDSVLDEACQKELSSIYFWSYDNLHGVAFLSASLHIDALVSAMIGSEKAPSLRTSRGSFPRHLAYAVSISARTIL